MRGRPIAPARSRSASRNGSHRERLAMKYMGGAASAVRINVPSPLVGEGSAVLQRERMGEGYLLRRDPLTQPRLLQGLAALSHKGRGQNNKRSARCIAF